MPIVYNPELQGWEVKDSTPEEQKALLAVACDVITQGLGHNIAQQLISQHFGEGLEDIPVEEMGRA